MMIQIRPANGAVDPILKAISSLVAEGQVELFELQELPKPTNEEDQELESTAQKIAKLIRPTARQPMRGEALKVALVGWDTFMDQKGEADPSLRNALGAVSKAMRPIFPYDSSPIDRLATRRKRFDDHGGYLGTVYTPTKLGIRVKEILEAENAL